MSGILTRLYDADDAAGQVVVALEQQGIEAGAIRVIARIDGIMAALAEAGVAHEEAEVYAEGVRRGGTLVCVSVDTAQVDAACAALDSQSWVEFGVRREAYRRSGWTGFDHQTPALSEEQIAHERTR